MKIATIVGARPQFIKACPVSQALVAHNTLTNVEEDIFEEVMIHTGQHYDHEMSGVFFETLNLGEPKYNLGVGSGSHGAQLAGMIRQIEEVLMRESPDLVLIYGDTNSTLAGALMADRLNIPVAHVEAGLRSFNRKMPEECNRIVADRLSALLFAPTKTAVENLAREGITDGVYEVGDVMHEAAMAHSKIAESRSIILRRLGLIPEDFVLTTVHRQENADAPARLQGILEGLAAISKTKTIVWPVHPRTRKQLTHIQERGLASGRILLTDPVSYHDMLMLERSASVILTDSGGVQKEAFWFGVPCVTLREETEWVETVGTGRNELAGCCGEKIRAAFETALRKPRLPISPPELGARPSKLIVERLSAFGRSIRGTLIGTLA